MSSLEISHRLHATSGAPDRRATLPELPGATLHEPPALDRVGERLQDAWPVVAAGAVGGGLLGSMLLRTGGGGALRGLVRGAAGVLAGASLALAGLSLADGNQHTAPSVAQPARAASTEVAAREQVTVMTYNIHGGMGGPGEFGSSKAEMDRLADVIRREDPDIVLLQEVDDFAARSNWTDNLRQLDRRLDPDSSVAAGASTRVTGRDQHTAIMTFNGFAVADARNIVHQDRRGGGIGTRGGAQIERGKHAVDAALGTELARGSDDYQARNTLEALVRTPAGSDLRVLSGHYSWPTATVDHQQRQVGELSGALAAWDGPTIWGGDFNVSDGTRRGQAERRLLARAGLHDTLAGVSQHRKVSLTSEVPTAVRGDQRAEEGGIDRVYASAHAQVRTARVVRAAGDASDHLPVVAELELVPE